MHTHQSVAEHSFRVAAIASTLAHHLGLTVQVQRECITWALIHDASEGYSGDPPAPFKDEIGRQLVNAAEDRMVSWLSETKSVVPNHVIALVKIADQIEGYTWWMMHGDKRMNHPWITKDGPMACNLLTIASACHIYADRFGPDLTDSVHKICDSIMGVDNGDAQV